VHRKPALKDDILRRRTSPVPTRVQVIDADAFFMVGCPAQFQILCHRQRHPMIRNVQTVFGGIESDVHRRICIYGNRPKQAMPLTLPPENNW